MWLNPIYYKIDFCIAAISGINFSPSVSRRQVLWASCSPGLVHSLPHNSQESVESFLGLANVDLQENGMDGMEIRALFL